VKEFMGFVQESAYEIRVNRLYFITTLPTIWATLQILV
jgi:hypothetical protein